MTNEVKEVNGNYEWVNRYITGYKASTDPEREGYLIKDTVSDEIIATFKRYEDCSTYCDILNS